MNTYQQPSQYAVVDRKDMTHGHSAHRIKGGPSPFQAAVLETADTDKMVRVPIPSIYRGSGKARAYFSSRLRANICHYAKRKGLKVHSVVTADGQSLQLWVTPAQG